MTLKRPSSLALAATSLLLSVVVGTPCGAEVIHPQSQHWSQSVAVGVDVLPASDLNETIARRGGGGGGGRRGGGGGRRGGGMRMSPGGRGRTGFGRQGVNRGSFRPSGGWSRSTRGVRGINSGRRNNLNRTIRNINRGRYGNGWRGGRSSDLWRRAVRPNRIDRRTPGWARRGWRRARPWGWGWYGRSRRPAWGWWDSRAVGWGLGALAATSVINNLVDVATESGNPTVIVPETDIGLRYESVEPVGASATKFWAEREGTIYQLTADCEQGLLDGEPPGTPEEAQLLNASCQVTFGE